jgi:hypothetical protein
MDSTLILKAVESVTKKWTKQRKAEERGRARTSRQAVMTRTSRIEIKYAAWTALPDAYQKASGGGKYPVAARQLYYAVRPYVLEESEKSELDSQYFTQRILPEYVASHREETADWDVVYDARGHFQEPHTGVITPLGTLDVRQYLGKIGSHAVENLASDDFCADDSFPTCGPAHRFGAVLFIEKEGFLPLFKAAKLAERYDIAVMSTKGMPVVACRRLADELCGSYDIPLLMLHDFDKAGFSIVGTLQGVEKEDRDCNPIASRYEYQHDIAVIDLGIRLEDVEQYKLESEPVKYRSDPSGNLEANGATPEEIKFLCQVKSWNNLDGRRVELNAFTSGDLIEWIEAKLKAHGIEKVVPDADTLKAAYRRAVQIAAIEARLEDIIIEAGKEGEKAAIPRGLAKKIGKALKDNPEQSWDAALAKIVQDD